MIVSEINSEIIRSQNNTEEKGTYKQIIAHCDDRTEMNPIVENKSSLGTYGIHESIPEERCIVDIFFTRMRHNKH